MKDTDRRRFLAHSGLSVFRRHVDQALVEIERAIKIGKSLVSTSWGKDSVALCDLALRMDPTLPLVHLRSPYELPGGEHVERHFRERGAELVDIPTLRTLPEYIDWLQRNGLGYERETHRGAGSRRKCNEIGTWALTNGVELQILGMRGAESVRRRKLFASRGLTYQRADGGWISNPLGWWSSDDVWAYLVSRDLPWHRLYDCESHGVDREQLRNCGWLTVQGDVSDWRIPWLRRHFPEQYELLAESFPRVRLF